MRHETLSWRVVVSACTRCSEIYCVYRVAIKSVIDIVISIHHRRHPCHYPSLFVVIIIVVIVITISLSSSSLLLSLLLKPSPMFLSEIHAKEYKKKNTAKYILVNIRMFLDSLPKIYSSYVLNWAIGWIHSLPTSSSLSSSSSPSSSSPLDHEILFPSFLASWKCCR